MLKNCIIFNFFNVILIGDMDDELLQKS